MIEPSNGGAIAVRDEDLPPIVNYDQAKRALAECERVDEVKEIADRAVALKVYAQQANDTELEATAQRIRLRAKQRMGELLKSVPVGTGGRPPKTRGAVPPVSRKAVAEGAGIGEQQAKDAVRIANVPKDEFEEAVEQPKPPSVRELARQGQARTATKPPPPPDSPQAVALSLTKFGHYLRRLNVKIFADAIHAAPNAKELLDDVQQACTQIEDRVIEIMHTA